MSRFKIGDRAFHVRDIGMPTVMEVVSVFPVRERNGRITGFRYCLNVLGTGQMRNFVQGELALYVGPVTVTARFPEPSSSQYPMRTPPLSQLTGTGPAWNRVKTYPPPPASSQSLITAMLPTPFSTGTSANSLKPPPVHSPIQAQKIGYFSFLDPSQTPPDFRRGQIFARASKLKITGVASLLKSGDFSQVDAPASDDQDQLLSQEFDHNFEAAPNKKIDASPPVSQEIVDVPEEMAEDTLDCFIDLTVGEEESRKRMDMGEDILPMQGAAESLDNQQVVEAKAGVEKKTDSPPLPDSDESDESRNRVDKGEDILPQQGAAESLDNQQVVEDRAGVEKKTDSPPVNMTELESLSKFTLEPVLSSAHYSMETAKNMVRGDFVGMRDDGDNSLKDYGEDIDLEGGNNKDCVQDYQSPLYFSPPKSLQELAHVQAELYQSTSKGKGMNRMQEKVEKCPTHKVFNRSLLASNKVVKSKKKRKYMHGLQLEDSLTSATCTSFSPHVSDTMSSKRKRSLPKGLADLSKPVQAAPPPSETCSSPPHNLKVGRKSRTVKTKTLPSDYNPTNPFNEELPVEELAKLSNMKVLKDKRYLHTWREFEVHVKSVSGDMWVKLLAGVLLDEEVDLLLANFLKQRQNLQELKKNNPGVRLDTSTFQTLVCRLTAMVSIQTKYRPCKSPKFHIYKGVKKNYMLKAKEQGKGRQAGQAASISVAETNFLFQDSQLSVWTPQGLQTLVFFHLTTCFNIRICKEMKAVTLGDLVHIGEPDGKISYTIYTPGATKKDDGTRVPSDIGNAFKRPVNVARYDLEGGDKKYDLVYVLSHLRYHLFKLPWVGDRSSMPLFWSCKKNHYKPGECFFLPQPLGRNTYNEIVRDVVTRTGLDTGSRKISNQSLRTSTVVIQKAAGLTLAQMSDVNGHINERTAKIYDRGCCQDMADHSRKTQSVATGLPISESPDFSYACLRDGTKVFPRSVLTSTASGPGLVLVKEHKIVRREGHMDLTHTLTTGSIPDLNHSKALEGGRVQIVLRGDHQDTELGREDSEEEDVSSDSEEEKMSATPPIVRKLSARGSSSSSQPDPPARQGSSRSGRRRIMLPGYLEVNKRIRQSLLDTDDSDEGDEYKPPGPSAAVSSASGGTVRASRRRNPKM